MIGVHQIDRIGVRREPERLQDRVHDARRLIGECDDDAAVDRPGDEVRERRDDVDPLFEKFVAHLVENKREYDGCGEIEQQQDQIHDQRIRHDVPEIHILQKRRKVIEPDPVAEEQDFEKVGGIVSILEPQQKPDHRQIMKNENHEKPERGNYEHRPVTGVPFFPFFPTNRVVHRFFLLCTACGLPFPHFRYRL